MKDVRNQGEGVCPVRTKEGGCVLRMRTSAFFGTKKFGFFEIYGVSARTRGVEPVRSRGEESHFFAILYGRLLWTAPYCISEIKHFVVNSL